MRVWVFPCSCVCGCSRVHACVGVPVFMRVWVFPRSCVCGCSRVHVGVGVTVFMWVWVFPCSCGCGCSRVHACVGVPVFMGVRLFFSACEGRSNGLPTFVFAQEAPPTKKAGERGGLRGVAPARAPGGGRPRGDASSRTRGGGGGPPGAGLLGPRGRGRCWCLL